MTEKNTDLIPATVDNRASDEAYTAYASNDASSQRKSLAGPALLVAGVLVVALAAALWYQQTSHRETTQQLTGLVQSAREGAQQAQELASRLERQAQQQAAKLAVLEDSLAESRAQVDTLAQAFQALTDTGSDLVLLNDVDHLVTIAQQQLQLGGNVANAIVALETAQAQLARANRPNLASLQQTINGDLDRLRAVSTIDVALITDQLDTLGVLVSQAPLLVPDDAMPKAQTQASEFTGFSVPPVKVADSAEQTPWWETGLQTAGNWFSSVWNSLRHDLGQFIAVRRVDDAAAMLMSPDQAARFRENLRLRIMTAQLALMMRQPKVWQAETDALVKALESRFEGNALDTRKALKIARQLQETVIDTRLPTVTNSLQAIETLREEQARRAPVPADSTESPSAVPDQTGASALPQGASVEPSTDSPGGLGDGASNSGAPVSPASRGAQTQAGMNNQGQG
jgi:uroporphyrin-3 C-methyltransferase